MLHVPIPLARTADEQAEVVRIFFWFTGIVMALCGCILLYAVVDASAEEQTAVVALTAYKQSENAKGGALALIRFPLNGSEQQEWTSARGWQDWRVGTQVKVRYSIRRLSGHLRIHGIEAARD